MHGVSTPPVPASRKVYEHVKQRLLDGSLRDGELLSEGTIADAVGVSRTPVREAFLQLESEGLLALYPKRGALVVPVSPREVRDIYEARLLVEGHGLRRALEGPVERLLEELDASLDEQRRLLERDDLVAFTEADRRLHRAWVAAAGNEVLLHVFDQLRDRQQRISVTMLLHHGSRAQQLLEEHERLVEAVRARDLDGFLARLDQHFDAARTALDRPTALPR